jgi:hypothetical protein
MVWAILNPDQSEAMFELINSRHSDRIVAVVGGALLDDSIRRALELRLRPKDGDTDMNEKLFKVSGPLGNLGPKIDLGYQLYMLDKPVRNSMYGINEIRNLFAHNLNLSFDDTKSALKTALGKLTLHHGREQYPSISWIENSGYNIEPIETVKDKFIVNLQLCLIWLMGDQRKHILWSNAPRENAST